MSLIAVSDLLKESDAMLDEVLKIRSIIQQSKDESAEELLRRIRYEAVAAQFIPPDIVTTQQLEENARLLKEQEEASDILQDIKLTDEEVRRFELELQERAKEGIDTRKKSHVASNLSKPSSRSNQQKMKGSSNGLNTQTKTHENKRSQQGKAQVQQSYHKVSTDNSMSTELSDTLNQPADSAILLSAILHENASDLQEDRGSNYCDMDNDIPSESHDLDDMLDGLLDYYETLENDRADGHRGRVFQTELPTIIESQIASTDTSQCIVSSEAVLPPKPACNLNDIYDPNFTMSLTEKENKRVEEIMAGGLPTENAFRLSNEDIRRDAEICAQLSMLVPLDRSDIIFAPTFTTDTTIDGTIDTASTSQKARPYTHTSSSTIMTLSEPSHMTERGRELWNKYTKGLPMNEPLDIFVPRLKSGVPDYLREQHRDSVLAQYYSAISQCLNELKKDNSVVHMTGKNIQEALTDFYMTPTNFELVSDLHKAMNESASSSIPLRSVGDDEAPLTPQLMQKPEDLVRNILPMEDREKLDNILSKVRNDALEIIETDEYYKDLNLDEYIKTTTALKILDTNSESVLESPIEYTRALGTDDNPGIQDPLLLKIYRERQAAAQKSNTMGNNSYDFSDSDDYDFEDYNAKQVLTEQEIERESKKLLIGKDKDGGKLYTILQDGTGLNTEVMSGATGPTIMYSSLNQASGLSITELGSTGAATSGGTTKLKGKAKKPLTNTELLAKKSESLSNKFQEIIRRSKPSDMATELTNIYSNLQPDDVDQILSVPQVKQHIQSLKEQGVALLDLEPVNIEYPSQSAIAHNQSLSSATLSASSGRSSAKPVLAKSSTKVSKSKVHSKIPQIQDSQDSK